jgi:hypothetical protein
LQNQLGELFPLLSEKMSGNKTMVLLLRRFLVYERSGATSELGLCSLKAALYAAVPGGYQQLNDIDTTLTIKGFDVTQKLLEEAGKIIPGYIAAHLADTQAIGSVISPNALQAIDSVEKRMLPVYNTAVYKNGLYGSYRSFTSQTPDKEAFTVKLRKDSSIISVYTLDERQKKQLLSPEKIYAVVYQGIPYVSTQYGYYPLKYINDDFHFRGKALLPAQATDQMIAAAYFTLFGQFAPAGPDGPWRDLKLNYEDGSFILIKKGRED